MGCDIVTVSTDTQFTHLAWQRSEKELANVKYTMGADPTAKVSRMFVVYNEDNGLGLRPTHILARVGYVERHLLPDERVLYKTRLHWVLYVKAALVTLVGVVLAVVLAQVNDPPWLWYVGVAVAAMGAVWWLVRWIE